MSARALLIRYAYPENSCNETFPSLLESKRMIRLQRICVCFSVSVLLNPSLVKRALSLPTMLFSRPFLFARLIKWLQSSLFRKSAISNIGGFKLRVTSFKVVFSSMWTVSTCPSEIASLLGSRTSSGEYNPFLKQGIFSSSFCPSLLAEHVSPSLGCISKPLDFLSWHFSIKKQTKNNWILSDMAVVLTTQAI